MKSRRTVLYLLAGVFLLLLVSPLWLLPDPAPKVAAPDALRALSREIGTGETSSSAAAARQAVKDVTWQGRVWMVLSDSSGCYGQDKARLDRAPRRVPTSLCQETRR